MWKSRGVCEISKRCGTGGKPAFGFPPVPQRGISTALFLARFRSVRESVATRKFVTNEAVFRHGSLCGRARCGAHSVAPENFELVQRLVPMLHHLPFRRSVAQRQVEQFHRTLFIRKRAPVLDDFS